MSPDEDLPDLEAEHLLRAARPRPSADFVAATERRLLGRPRARRRDRRPLLAGLGLSGALAAAVVVAGLAGAGPLAPDGAAPGGASSRCHTVRVSHVQPVGTIVRHNGRVVVVKHARRVSRLVTRCP